jgi:enoyl-CoA hydratase/carnithine racemase
MSGEVVLHTEGSLARVRLSNAPRFNAMSRAMWRQLRDVFRHIQQDKHLTCVVVHGEKHFCAGGDISEYPEFRFDESSLMAFHEEEVWGGLQAMLDCDVPLIAHIEGNCMGAGVEIASCCDMRFASEAAQFGAPIARLGFPMAPRESALVARALGDLTAREMLLTAAVFPAAELLRRGFLNQVLAASELDAVVHAVTERIGALAPQAARMNKQSFRALTPELNAPIATDLIASAYRYADSTEHREGIAAFLEKRPARFHPEEKP